MKKKLVSTFLASILAFGFFAQQFSMVKDIQQGVFSSYPGNFSDYNGELLFTANSNIDGYCLFKSDGTNSGTNVLKDQWQGSQIEWFQFVNGKLFQSSHDKTNKIWYTNGTPTGTYVIYDLLGTFPSASICSDLIYLNNYVYFITKEYDNVWGNITHKICRSNANFQNIDVVHQWSNTFSQGTWFKFDNVLTNVIIGTGNGTWSLNTLNNSVFQLSSDLTIFGNVSKVYYNNKIYYSKNNNLYSIDGTNSGVTDLQIGIPIRELVVFNNLIYFSGGSIGTGQSGIELYKTNGTPLNTSLVSDIFFGFNSSEPRDFNVVNNKLFFVGNSINDITIYCYDPILNNVLNTSATTLVEISDRKTQLVGFNNLLYYSAPVSSWDIWKLWETNGTSNSAILTQNIDLTKDSACIGDFYVVNNKLFFVACDSQHGQELWSSVTNNSLGMGLEENVNFSIFPNPTSHSITIKGEKNMNQSFSIFDQMGREVFKGKLIGTETEVNLSSLSKGIYTLKIDGNYQPTQIVKE